jgi:hypothetical protein
MKLTSHPSSHKHIHEIKCNTIPTLLEIPWRVNIHECSLIILPDCLKAEFGSLESTIEIEPANGHPLNLRPFKVSDDNSITNHQVQLTPPRQVSAVESASSTIKRR